MNSSRPSWTSASAQSGMTIIEILIVIALIGTLMTIIMTNILDKSDDAKQDLAAISAQKLAEGLKLYKFHNNHFPASEEGLAALLQAPASAKKWRGPYTESDKLNDPWSQPFLYECADGRNFTITSPGSDGELGTKDDIIYPPTSKGAEDGPVSIELTLPKGQSDSE